VGVVSAVLVVGEDSVMGTGWEGTLVVELRKGREQPARRKDKVARVDREVRVDKEDERGSLNWGFWLAIEG